MTSPYDLDYDQRVQKTLQELCVAEFAQYYCGECASGRGCCVDDRPDQQREYSPSRSVPERVKEVMREPEEMEESEAGSDGRRVRRQKLTIDLSNDEDLSDGEILRRLLSPLGSPLSDEPLEVILEIVDEEDEDEEEENEYENPAPKKTFKSLREKLREVTGGFSNRENNKTRSRHEPQKVKYDLHHSSSTIEHRPLRRSYSSVKMCPSFQKANSLINEIERCFIETACLVEKTLEASNCPQNSELKFEGITSPASKSGTTEQLTQTIEEALHIFDSVLSESKNQVKSEKGNEHHDQIKSKNDAYEVNSQCSPFSSGNAQNHTDITESKENWYSQALRGTHNDRHLNKLNRKNLPSGFERDIDELFKECYALSSIEPNTSLPSCLKNLESLCVQLRRAKENILLEMKEEYNKKMEVYDESFDCNTSQTSSLDSQECLSFINELIERKLKDKLKQKKFSLDPPLMGLEGKTHKIIAEVLPLTLVSENGRFTDNENVLYQNSYRSNDGKTQDSAYGSNNTMNISSGENDVYSESNSEMSTTTNTLDSNRCASFSPQAASDRSEDPYLKCSLSETTEEEQNLYMSYEETLALYEDNQELQKSLLSILHSLNDIHDNFLNRRRMEIAMSQKSSSFIHNHLKAEICSSFQKENNCHTEALLNNSMENVDSYTKELNFVEKRSLSSKFNDDSESIEKIIGVSEELKNLWLYGTDDLRLRNRKPTRSVSFNRGIKRYNKRLRRYEDPSSDEFDYGSVINEKSLSMPNLSNLSTAGHDTFPLSPNEDSAQLPKSFQSSVLRKQNQENFIIENFANQNKSENAKCYEVTQNFLQRIIDACSIVDKNGDERCDFLKAEHVHPYNAYLRTCS